jgi:hypothetical protein
MPDAVERGVVLLAYVEPRERLLEEVRVVDCIARVG